MNVIFYISAVYMLYLGAAQLYRVFFGELCNEKDAVLMEDSKDIFSDIHYCKNDVDYFKQIRAIFGEHSVSLNLNEMVYPPEERKNHKDERWFASWSYSLESGRPTEVYIYSNKPGSNATRISIDLNEIEEFAYTVNQWIAKITNKALDLERKLKEELKNSPWPVFDKTDYNSHIDFLMKENEKRSDDDWYRLALTKVRVILNSDYDNELVKKLKEEALLSLERLHQAIHSLEDIDDCELDTLEPNLRMNHSVLKAYNSLAANVLEKINNMDYSIWGGFIKRICKAY